MCNGKKLLNCQNDDSSLEVLKAGHSDPVSLKGKLIEQQIKVTLGITGLYFLRVPIDENVWHLDVGLTYPGGAVASKGLTVRQLKWYVRWVQNVVKQFGSYLFLLSELVTNLTLVREDRIKLTSGGLVVINCTLSS